MSSLLAFSCLLSVKKQTKLLLFSSIYNKTIIKFGFCDIHNNQGLGKGYQPKPRAEADNSYFDLDYYNITKTSSNNCLISKRVLSMACSLYEAHQQEIMQVVFVKTKIQSKINP